MKSLNNIRTKTGISQKALALLLKTGYTSIVMAEKGQRQLSSRALLRIAEIEKYMNDEFFLNAVQERRDLPSSGLEFYKERCKAMLVNHTFNLACLKTKLLRMEKEYAEGTFCMELFDRIELSNLRENECMVKERERALRKIEFGDPLAQEKVKHKIHSLEADHNYLSGYLEKC